MEGTELYKPSEHLDDRFLADSLFPRVVQGIMQHFGQREVSEHHHVTVETETDGSLKRAQEGDS